MKFKTIRSGEQAVIFNYMGEGRVVKGPERIFLFRERCEKMLHYTATPSEFLAVQYITGETTHIPGPCEMFLNPLEQQNISIKVGIHIDSNHIIIVYRRLKDSSVDRRVIQGPTMFFPTADEWLHNFEWHGPDPNEIGRMIPNKTRCTQLACIPDQFYYNVRDVRTKDDTTVQVNLMIFYELKDVIKMLEATHDPIADMINAVCADIIAFAGKRTFVQFLENVNEMGKLDIYPQLLQRVERIGYNVAKVVYRGYIASPKLQAMQDAAIQSRTKLRLKSELAEQEQKLSDFKLSKERERTALRQRMELNKKEHKQKTEKLSQEHDLKQRELAHNVKMEVLDMYTRANLECEAARLEHETEHMQRLKELGVHLTDYLLNKNGAPISHEYRIEPEHANASTAVPVKSLQTTTESHF